MNGLKCRFCLVAINTRNRGVSLFDLQYVMTKVFTFPIQLQGELPFITCNECTSIVLTFFHYSERVQSNQYKLLASAVAAHANGIAGDETPGTSQDVRDVVAASDYDTASLVKMTQWMNWSIGTDPVNGTPLPIAAGNVSSSENVSETNRLYNVTAPECSQSSPDRDGNAATPPRLKMVHVQFVPGCYLCEWIKHGRSILLRNLQSGQADEATKRAIKALKRKIVLKRGCAFRT